VKQFAVIGHPIGHSLSPLMHNTAFQILGLDCKYDLIDIEPASLKNSVERFRDKPWGGFNVTVPYKETIMPLIDNINPEALSVGAVNTVVNRNQSLIGYNTDVIGVERSLLPFQERIKEKKCVIIGSGGVARSVTHVLVNDFKVKQITFIAILPEQAKLLADDYRKKDTKFVIFSPADESVEIELKNCALIVNATAIGMYPNIDESPVMNRQVFSKEHIVFDVIYRPLKTKLLTDAQKAGASIVGGLDMFIHQGAAAFKLWTGLEMPMEQIRRVLEEKLAS
jgi:shikimate dehydrogenase